MENLKNQIHATTYIQIIITSILLVASLYIILSQRYAESDLKWAYGTVGTIMGYWLKPSVSD